VREERKKPDYNPIQERNGRITGHPNPHGTEGNGMFKSILKKLIYIRGLQG
jgi:hypothetical protein